MGGCVYVCMSVYACAHACVCARALKRRRVVCINGVDLLRQGLSDFLRVGALSGYIIETLPPHRLLLELSLRSPSVTTAPFHCLLAVAGTLNDLLLPSTTRQT